MKKIIELNKEYTYKEICEALGWKVSAGNSKRAQIKEIESAYKFYHPINKKTHKEKKSYIFTIQKRKLIKPSLENSFGNNNKNIIPMMDYLMCISKDLYTEVPYTFTTWFCSLLDLMDKDTYNEPYKSEEHIKLFCIKHNISNIQLFKDYIAIIKKTTKDIFIKSLEVLSKKNLAKYTDGYKFYYKIYKTKREYIDEVFSNQLNELIIELEEKNCNLLNKEYNLSEKISYRQLLMLIFKNSTIREQFNRMMIDDINKNEISIIINQVIDKEYSIYSRHINEKHEIISCYRAISISALDERNKNCDKESLAKAVTNIICQVSRKHLLNKKWKDKNNYIHYSYNEWDNVADMIKIEKLLLTYYDLNMDNTTSFNLIELDNEYI